MRLSLDRWLWLLAPLWAALPAYRKKRVPKPHKSSKSKLDRAKKPIKPAAPPRPSNPARQGKERARGRPAVPVKPVQKPAARTPARAEPAEPPPKPVQPVGRPFLLSPEQGRYADSVNPKFRWLSVGGATRYEVSWSQDPALTNAYVVVSAATEAAVPVEKPLTVGVVYYWRARGGNEAGWGPWSNVGSFSVLEEPG